MPDGLTRPIEELPYEPMSDGLAAQRGICVELNRNESRILLERLKAHLTFQGFLFAAVGVAAGQHIVPLAVLISIVGIVACIPGYLFARISYNGLESLGNRFRPFVEEGYPPLDAVSIEPWQFRILPEVFLPIVNGITWLAILTLVALRWIG
jgi:hypothetical protein